MGILQERILEWVSILSPGGSFHYTLLLYPVTTPAKRSQSCTKRIQQYHDENRTTPLHSDCSLENKRCLLLGRKTMTNLDSILKSRDISLPTKVCLVKAMVFPVVMYGCENWTIKKVQHQRIDAFELRWWRRLLRVPWAAKRYNQNTLKEIGPEYSLEGLILKFKLQYRGHLMQGTDSFEETLMLGKIEGRRRRG